MRQRCLWHGTEKELGLHLQITSLSVLLHFALGALAASSRPDGPTSDTVQEGAHGEGFLGEGK